MIVLKIICEEGPNGIYAYGDEEFENTITKAGIKHEILKLIESVLEESIDG